MQWLDGSTVSLYLLHNFIEFDRQPALRDVERNPIGDSSNGHWLL